VSAPAGHALPGAIADAVGSRRTLLVLDNCEHVLESCAALADALLRACPGLTVLATSRVALGGDGETVWPLPPLAHPARTPGAPSGAFGGGGGPAAAPVPAGEAELAALAEYGSVQLFVARARAASPRFALTAQNAAAVRAVCARLDGLPLALELAAAAVGVLGVEQVAARLDDAFAVLTRGRRTALPRHRTLGALLDWSYDLLGPAERRLLARLSVFRAAVPIEAVEAVGGDDADDADVLGAFAGLVDHSLVDVGERDGEPHYRLLETVRQYAAERLRAAPADEAATRRRHARWMAARADVMGEETGGPRRGRAMAGFHPLVEDARAALEWSTGPDGDRVDALRVAGGLAIFWHWAGLWAEGRRWAEAAVRAADTAAANAARVTTRAAPSPSGSRSPRRCRRRCCWPGCSASPRPRSPTPPARSPSGPRPKPTPGPTGPPVRAPPSGPPTPTRSSRSRASRSATWPGPRRPWRRRSRPPTVRGAAGREGSRSAGAPCSRRPPAARPTPPATWPAPKPS
jgi:predicted ATPase